MIRRLIIISTILVLYSTSSLFSQGKVLQGKVTTFDSIPLIGVSIQVKSTKEVVHSDSVGMFTASCLPKDKLKVTAKGFSQTQNVKIEEKIKYVFVNLKLRPGRENREMAIGYGHVKDKDRLYAISSLNERDMDFSQYTDIYEIIRGRFTGVEITGGEIIIRGGQTFLGSDAALLVVDGVIVDQDLFGAIATTDIASINVLKDASASVYGSRGANGVVMVETKSGN